MTSPPRSTQKAVEKHGIRYKKIKANFGDRSPSTEAVEAFIETVNEFMRDDEEGEAEIAVVCTYGTNREFQISLEMWFMILSIQTDLRSLSLMILYYHDFIFLGTNRSGYLICRHLMETLEMDPEDAIERFELARGEGFDPNKPVLKNQLLAGLNHCKEHEERISQMLRDKHGI